MTNAFHSAGVMCFAQACADVSPDRSFTLPFSVAKALNLQKIAGSAVGAFKKASYIRISASNVSASNMSAIMALHKELFDDFVGMARGTTVSKTVYFTTY